MISYLVKFFVISITIPSTLGGGDSYTLEFEEVSDVETDMQGVWHTSGPKFTGKPYEVRQIVAAVRQKAPSAVFDKDVQCFPQAGGKVTRPNEGSAIYNVVSLNTTPKMWVRPRSPSGTGYYLMVRSSDIDSVC